MNGVHDMGGVHGFGPVNREMDEPRFHAAWEGHVLAIDEIVSSDLQLYNIDAFRYGIEQMPPAHYLRSSYYERWLATIEYNLDRIGIVTHTEVEARVALLQDNPAAPLPAVTPSAYSPAPPPPDAGQPPLPARFGTGDSVRVRNNHPAHHTRAPRYVRGKHGVINLVHGAYILPDTHAHDGRECRQTVYSVRFPASDLWGPDAEPNQTVSIDLWECYLEPA